jgi:hypothetical protein
VKARLEELRAEYADPHSNEVFYHAMVEEQAYINLEREANAAWDYWVKREKDGGLSASDHRAADRAGSAWAEVSSIKDLAVDEARRDLTARRQRADAAKGVNWNGTDRRRGGARGVAIANIERSKAPDDVKQRVVEAVEADDVTAESVAVRSNPDYLTAFLKHLRDPQMGHLE